MSIVKKQHFVPRIYLRSFSSDGEHIFVFDKPNKRSFGANIDDVAQEKYFYDTNEEDFKAMSEALNNPSDFLDQLKQDILASGNRRFIDHFMADLQDPLRVQEFIDNVSDKQFVEKHILGPVESETASVLRDILKEIKWRKRIKPSQKKRMAFIAAIQFARTRRFREESIEIREKTLTELLKRAEATESDEDVRARYDRSYEDRITTERLLDLGFINTLTNVFNSRIWIVGINNTKTPLYTSDAPIVRHQHAPRPYVGAGLALPDVEIAYPLSSEYILLLWDEALVKIVKPKSRNSLVLTEENVVFYNSLQVDQSYRQVYCSNNDFDLAVKMCEKDPDIMNPNRPRVSVL